MKTFKTPKGTELPFLNLRGKDYLEVKYRLVWFREEKPDWGITTEFVQLSPDLSIAKATVCDPSGRIIAQGTKSETPNDFPDYIEKSESGAIGRALAILGYGTQFAPELEENERIVDSPVSKPAVAPKPAAPKETFKGRGSTFDDSGVKVSDAQLKRLFALSKNAGLDDDGLKKIVTALGYSGSRKDMTRGFYDKLCTEIEKIK